MAKNSKIIIGPYRCLYPALGTPKSFKKADGSEDKAKFSVKLLIPKTDKAGVKKILDFIEKEVKATNWPKTVQAQVLKVAKDQDPYNDNAIVKDGDKLNQRKLDEEKEIFPAYEGHYVVGINRPASWGGPLVTDAQAEPIPSGFVDASIVGGYWINIQVSAYCYEAAKKGVTLRLLAVQKVREDEAFGQVNPFEAVDEEETGGDPFAETA